MSKAKVSTLAISLFFIVVCTCKPRLVRGDNYCDSEQRLSYHYKLWALHLTFWGYVEGAETTLQWHYPVIPPQQLRAILRNRPTANNSLTKLYICSLLLLNACDTDTNPGPGADHSTVYPCGACDMPVTWAQQAVACETCSVWYHIDCQGISSQTYDALHSSAVVWNCHSCGVTNYTATLFDLTSLVTSNSFSSLQEDSSIHSIGGSPGPPLAASSPTPRQRRKPNNVKRPLRLVNANFHSIRNKQAEVLNLRC